MILCILIEIVRKLLVREHAKVDRKKKKSKNNFPNLKQFLFCLLKSKSCVEKDVTERHI